jgi:hypothetical protein
MMPITPFCYIDMRIPVRVYALQALRGGNTRTWVLAGAG